MAQSKRKCLAVPFDSRLQAILDAPLGRCERRGVARDEIQTNRNERSGLHPARSGVRERVTAASAASVQNGGCFSGECKQPNASSSQNERLVMAGAAAVEGEGEGEGIFLLP